MTSRRLLVACAGALVAVVSATVAPPALAAQQTAEPALLNLAWWWKDAQSEEVDAQGNKVELGTGNPFCPSVPGSVGSVHPATCAEQRLPVEIRGGDYEAPNMLSALGFDLSYLTPGSEVFEFKVTLLEAEAGCRDGSDQGSDCTPGAPGAEGDHVENTDPVGPVDDRQVKACLVPDIFGDVEARPYNEVPNYECSGSSPRASRKEIKAVDEGDEDGVDHVWTFDLTEYAQQWAESFTVATNVMLVGHPPQGTGPNDTWRVVFAGPRVEKGVRTKLVYEPGVIAPPIAPPITTGGSGFTGGTTDFGGGTATGSFGDTGTGTETPTTNGTPAPAASPGTDLAAEELPGVEGMPAYVWLAILFGLIGFTLVRQAVIESATGIRPDGVLARIHALNAERRGSIEAPQEPSPLSGLGAIAHTLGKKMSSLTARFKKG